MDQSSPQRTTFLATTPGVLLGALFSCLLWGSAFPCIKIGYQLFGIASTDTASQLLFAGVRFALAGILVIVFMSLIRREPLVPQRRDFKAIGLLALFQTILQYMLFYTGLSRAAGITSSIIEASANFLAIVFAAAIFRSEHLTSRKVVGCLIGFAGVVLINVGGSDQLQFALDGEGLVLLSTCAGAMSTCLIGHLGKTHDAVTLVGWQFLIGGMVISLAGLAGGGTLAPSGSAAPVLLVYMAFISAGAYTMWSHLLAVNPVSRVSVFGFMNPLFGAVLSAVLLGEGSLVDPVKAVIAMVLVAAGIIVVNRPPKDKASRAVSA